MDADDSGNTAAKEALWLFGQRSVNVRLGWTSKMYGWNFTARQPESLGLDELKEIQHLLAGGMPPTSSDQY